MIKLFQIKNYIILHIIRIKNNQIIEEYINHFSNFNFDQKIASKLILDLADKYKFDGSFVTYFMAKLNSNMCLSEDSSKKEIY